MFKRKKRFERKCDSLERWLLRDHQFLIKVLLTCQHPPTLKLTNGWEFMCELLELRGISGESNLTQILSQLKRIAQQFGHTQFIATSLESSPWRFIAKGWAARTENAHNYSKGTNTHMSIAFC